MTHLPGLRPDYKITAEKVNQGGDIRQAAYERFGGYRVVLTFRFPLPTFQDWLIEQLQLGISEKLPCVMRALAEVSVAVLAPAANRHLDFFCPASAAALSWARGVESMPSMTGKFPSWQANS